MGKVHAGHMVHHRRCTFWRVRSCAPNAVNYTLADRMVVRAAMHVAKVGCLTANAASSHRHVPDCTAATRLPIHGAVGQAAAQALRCTTCLHA